MENKAREILKRVQLSIVGVNSKQQVFEMNTQVLGKSGELSLLMHGLRDLAADQRAKIGQVLNEVRSEVDNLLRAKLKELDNKALAEKLQKEKVDVTIPVEPAKSGTLHPIAQTQKLLMDFFVQKGFKVRAGTDVETDFYCFEALNVPKNHPARDAQDTFYISDEIMLRTHTSATQIHEMERGELPIKIVTTGATYRVDEPDATHSPLFHQLEILVVDKGISLTDLKGTLEDVARLLFGDKTRIRMRPSYFPFTEPSAEVDASCPQCGGKGCALCKDTGWIELLGCGMVNPKILKNYNIDPNIYGAYAVGLGLDRITMLRHGIMDVRQLRENDVRFLKQFR